MDSLYTKTYKILCSKCPYRDTIELTERDMWRKIQKEVCPNCSSLSLDSVRIGQ
jgi:hypothetical protein